ncbi:CBO0543 family protein [Thalassobacillus pellis]|uniref:CBO0543 family protein n=1 Tax=Thalassobacillus pellis TaxID=748008 RepID=UPI001960DDE0|nr:CBO0543 family protein [Thalassobacillus pellis]MBM7553482.1 hypothetical protein [Thalassobacillus pellis]
MKKNQFEKNFLKCLFISGLLVMPFLFRRPPIKDWLIVYLLNAFTNGLIDKFVVHYGMVRYPVRAMKRVFDINILFDFLVYPLLAVWVNQFSKHDNLKMIAAKVMMFVLPMFFVEFWAEKKTNLVEWKKSWKWYYTLIGLSVKTLLNRMVISAVRRVDDAQNMKKAGLKNDHEQQSDKG